MAKSRTRSHTPVHVACLWLALAPLGLLFGSGCAPSQPDPAREAAKPSEPAPKAPTLPPPHTLVSEERIRESITALPVRRAAWSDDAHAKGLRDTEALLVERLASLGYQPELEPIDFLGARTSPAQAGDAPWNNILVTIPGVARPEELIVIATHFDAVPGSPGADDNASGVACLLELARVLKDRPMQRSLRLAFFNLEEVGLVGSRAHVQRLSATASPSSPPRPPRVVGMISLEMLGYYSDAPGSQRSPLPATDAFTPPSTGNFLALVGLERHQVFSQALVAAMHDAEPSLPVLAVDFLPIAPPDFARSDHAPFLAAGLPGVMLTDTANFRNRHYHTKSDTIDTLDMARLTLACKAVVGAAHRLGGPIGEPLIDLTPRPARPNEKAPPASQAGPKGS